LSLTENKNIEAILMIVPVRGDTTALSDLGVLSGMHDIGT